jgi:hypothetical protein
MSKSLLWSLAAICNFVSAAITYYDSGRILIVAMQLFAGLLMVIAAIKLWQKR